MYTPYNEAWPPTCISTRAPGHQVQAHGSLFYFDLSFGSRSLELARHMPACLPACLPSFLFCFLTCDMGKRLSLVLARFKAAPAGGFESFFATEMAGVACGYPVARPGVLFSSSHAVSDCVLGVADSARFWGLAVWLRCLFPSCTLY